jgi:hypothetical protein
MRIARGVRIFKLKTRAEGIALRFYLLKGTEEARPGPGRAHIGLNLLLLEWLHWTAG